jgi:acetyl esterase
MLHPQTRQLVDTLRARNLPPPSRMSVAQNRALYLERAALTQPDPPHVERVEALSIDTRGEPIGARLYVPKCAIRADGKPPVLVYFHGGGWVIGDLDSHDTLCRQLAVAAGIAVIAIDYRLAPEHPYPAAIEDAIDATYWVYRHARALGLDASRIAVGGDSAGGNLAAGVALYARDAGDLPLAFQLLIYPVTEMGEDSASYQAHGEGYLLTADTMRYFHDQYISDPAQDQEVLAAPLLAKDFSNLPPALVLTAGYDPLRDQGLAFAQRLSEAGSLATYVEFERQTHGFILMGKVIDEANFAVAVCATALALALSARQHQR